MELEEVTDVEQIALVVYVHKLVLMKCVYNLYVNRYIVDDVAGVCLTTCIDILIQVELDMIFMNLTSPNLT